MSNPSDRAKVLIDDLYDAASVLAHDLASNEDTTKANTARAALLSYVANLEGIVRDLAAWPPWSLHYEETPDGNGYSDDMEKSDGPCAHCGTKHGTPPHEHPDFCLWRRAREEVAK